ncbi:MAG TPA: aspartyl/asparaginyl beta-hydroxylase domain-containing protein [Allosphingosinicella sp.]|uniref:aspartyl/asparaginyl beta-hydroxylase domain-containing protein n=1 Tax=Allosphingosinicella sp. TaxID=2823234 RepID=UPI002ED8EAD4
MQLNNQEIERLAREGVAALQQGRPAEARSRFESVTATGRAGVQIWLLLATACRAQQDTAAEEAAVDQALKIEPQLVRGLVMKGDCRAKLGDDRNAVFLYKKALRLASDQTLPQDLVAELRRAETAAAQIDARFASDLDASLAAEGLPAERRSARFQHSLDIMAGRKQVYLQEPTGYYFPELPQVQYFDTTLFDWVPAVEAATDAIRQELVAVMEPGLDGFRPYIQSDPNQPRYHPLLDKRDWSALFFCENGVLSDEVIARCPKTWEAVQAAPLAWVGGWDPTVMFSLLRPGTRIPAHTGTHNTRLVCHLPLIVPPNCGFRVGNDVRQWEEGKLLIFDDTIEHEAWNDSSEDRVVLIFNIWRPELSERERRELTALFSVAGMGQGTNR